MQGEQGLQQTDLDLPTSVADAVKGGWLSYYDSDSDTSWWMNIFTKACEYYLPLNQAKYFQNEKMLNQLGLLPYEEDTNYIEADKTIALAWVIVFDYLDDGSQTQYYFNFITKASRWEVPNEWPTIIADWEDWLLCWDYTHESLYW